MNSAAYQTGDLPLARNDKSPNLLSEETIASCGSVSFAGSYRIRLCSHRKYYVCPELLHQPSNNPPTNLNCHALALLRIRAEVANPAIATCFAHKIKLGWQLILFHSPTNAYLLCRVSLDPKCKQTNKTPLTD